MGVSEQVQDSSYAGPTSAEPDSVNHIATNEQFSGPLSVKRSCTDIVCLALFLVVFLGFVVTCLIGLIIGNPLILFMGHESTTGAMCGTGALRQKMYLFNFDPVNCIAYKASSYMTTGCSPSICVESCPGSTTKPWNWPEDADKRLSEVPELAKYCLPGTDANVLVRGLVISGKCPPYIVPSQHFFFRCEPSFVANGPTDPLYTSSKTFKDKDAKELPVDDAHRNLAAAHNSVPFINDLINDLSLSWPHILIFSLISMALSFLWIIMLRFFGPCLIWFSVVFIVFGTGVAASFCWIVYDALIKQQEFALGIIPTKELAYVSSDIYLVCGLLGTILFLFMLIIFCAVFNRIRLAATIVSESSRAVAGSIGALFWPVIPFILQIAIHALFILGLFFFLTSTSTSNDSGQVISAATVEQNIVAMWPVMLALLFAWFWITNFILAINYVTLAGSFSSWYWNYGSPRAESCQLLNALGRSMRYHTGSMAFGSLIIALIQLVRAIFQFLEHQFRKMHNPIGYILMKCFICCIWCVEKFLKLITKNAYIMMALKGRNFCYSARKAFHLGVENSVRILVLDSISSVMISLSIFVIVSGLGVMALFVFYPTLVGWTWLTPIAPPVKYFYVPLIVEIVATLLAAICFFSVYKMAIDSIFLNLMYDLKYNDGTVEKPYRASKSLLTVVSKKNDKTDQ